MDARTDWLAALARDYADASDAARDDYLPEPDGYDEPCVEIPLIDEPDDDPIGVWPCCGGKRWHTDDCDQGPLPDLILDQIAAERDARGMAA